ncbi:hypothetical protein Q5752_005750 [Cryptotrichosporon argae]
MSNALQQSNAQPQVAGAAPPLCLQKRGLLGGKAGFGSIVSPTDNCLSPISAKLNGAKQRHFQKAKPVGLASQLSKLAAAGSASPAASEKKADL